MEQGGKQGRKKERKMAMKRDTMKEAKSGEKDTGKAMTQRGS